jgi:hypothetical protein
LPAVALVLSTVSIFLILALAMPARSILGLVAIAIGGLALVALLDAGVNAIRAVKGWRAWAKGIAFTTIAAGVVLFLFLPIPFGSRGLAEDCGPPVLGLQLRFPEATAAAGDEPRDLERILQEIVRSIRGEGSDALEERVAETVCLDVQRDWELRALTLVLVLAGALGVFAFRRR